MVVSHLKFPELSRKVWTVWKRNRDVFMKTYRVNFILPFLEPLLYLVALGFGLGFYVGTVDGVPYATFIAPSLLVAVQQVSVIFLPLVHVVHISRALTFGRLTASLLWDLGWIATVCVVLFILSAKMMKKRLIV